MLDLVSNRSSLVSSLPSSYEQTYLRRKNYSRISAICSFKIERLDKKIVKIIVKIIGK